MSTLELGILAVLIKEFKKREMKVIALSCDDVESHNWWIEDIKYFFKDQRQFPYPIIAEGRDLAVKLGMIDRDEKDAQGLPLTARAVSFTYSCP